MLNSELFDKHKLDRDTLREKETKIENHSNESSAAELLRYINLASTLLK